jgi:hypothetical protein
MGATLFDVLVVTIIGAALIIGSIVATAKSRWPVRFKNFDEQSAVCSVAWWAAKQLNIKPSDPRLMYSRPAWLYLTWMGSIPVEELALLSPFIDLVIDGKGPKQDLPAEYEDWHPKTLAAFKSRMQAEGLWPQPRS